MPNKELIVTASGRSLEEVKAGIRMRMRSMVFNALEIGADLIEAKEACEHGQWLPFLRDIGFSASTAANYMRIAREVDANSKIAELPYTKILAVLSAPPEEREELATAAEEMSAAEIRRLTEERNKAAEAANMESTRADQAEKELENERARHRAALEGVDELRKENDQLRADLMTAENNRVEVEKIPEDYEIIKSRLAAAERSAKDLIDAAADAEERAAAAEAELESVRAESAQNEVSEYEKMHFAMRTFLIQCETMACRPERLIRDAERIKKDVARLRLWCDAMDDAVTLHAVEGAVV